MPTINPYGTPGSATYSQDLGGLDQIMATLPDNTINQITAKNVRDSTLTMYNIIENAITSNLYQVTSVGNTTSNSIIVGGLSLNGTSSFNGTASFYALSAFHSNSTFYGNVNFNSTITDITGATGNGLPLVLAATNGGVFWTQLGGNLNLNQVTNIGNTTSNYIEVGSLQVDGTASIAENIYFHSTITDITGATGIPGYILSATAGGVVWIQPNISSSSNLSINLQTSNYTLNISDNSKLITMSNSVTAYVTVPSNATQSFSIGSQVQVVQIGAGPTSFTWSSPVIINSKYGYRTISAQYVTVSLTKIYTDTWLLSGDLIP